MTTIIITSYRGILMAEVNGAVEPEMTETVYDLGIGFGESFELDCEYDGDVWALIDKFEACVRNGR